MLDVLLCSGLSLSNLPRIAVRELQHEEVNDEVCDLAARVLGVTCEKGSEANKGSQCAKDLETQVGLDSSGFYAPLSETARDRSKQEAGQVRELLVKWASRAPVLANWAKAFWTEVSNLGVTGPQVRALLRSHGFVGPTSTSPPRIDELKKSLQKIESKGFTGIAVGEQALEDIES